MGSAVSYLAPARGCSSAPPSGVRKAGAAPARPRLLDRVRAALRHRHYSRCTEDTDVAWIRRYVLFHGKRDRAHGLPELSGGRPPRGGVHPEPGPHRASVPLPRRARGGCPLARRPRAREATPATPGGPHPGRGPAGPPAVERCPTPLMASLLYGSGLRPPVTSGRSRNSSGTEVSTTQIYTHVLNRGPSAVRSPVDTLLGG